MILQNFIVLEGIDGAGTSTQLKKLKEKLGTTRAFYTAEPVETSETGKFLRRILSGEVPVHPGTAAFLFAADRNEHLYGKDGIVQKDSEGILCFSDRYLFSSLAYQAATCGEDLPRLLNSTFPLPRILFFFKITPEVSLARITGRGVTEIYEKVDFLKKTEAEYEKVVASFREKADSGMTVVEIDASKSPDEVFSVIWKTLQETYGL
ncbi:MAG: dTMP kinase [Treponema sp.]|nr:dTMP kinase [Candidatus Treponema caballi]